MNFGFLIQYAHRKCVQRWCNEKGDIICEICHKVNQITNSNLYNLLVYNMFTSQLFVCSNASL